MNSNQKAYFGIFLYCLAFFLIRILSSNTLNSDEAEQFINSLNFEWGYSSQPPLFTWLLIAFNKVFQDGALSINLLKYVLFYFFLFYFYKVCKKLIDPKYIPCAVFSLVLFPAYSYELHRDLTHTTLLAFISVLCFYYFLKIMEKPSYLNYCIFGFIVALGFLAKYNFLLLVLPLALVSIFFKDYRAKLFNPKMPLSILIALITSMPHLLWLANNKFSSFSHAVNKSELGGAAITLTDIGMFIFRYFPSFVIAIAIIYILFFNKFKKEWEPFLLSLTITAFALPILITILFQGNYFNYRWLAPVFFLIPLLLFSNIEGDFPKARKIFIIICSITLVATFSMRFLFNFFPDLVDKGVTTNIPQQKIASVFAGKYQIKEKKTLIVSHNRMLLANLKNFQPDLDYFWIEELSIDYFISDNINKKKIRRDIFKEIEEYDQVFLLLNGEIKKVPKKYEKIFKQELSLLEPITINYLHSNKFTYTLNPVAVKYKHLSESIRRPT